MHKEMIEQIKKWRDSKLETIQNGVIADLGAYNINGSVKDIIPQCVGFDICKGNGVDVVIKPGEIPTEHLEKYDIVFCVNALNGSPNLSEFIDETNHLLKKNGILFLAYRLSHVTNHSMSPNEYGYKWRSISKEESNNICNEFQRKFELLERNKITLDINVFDEVLTLRKI